MAKEELQTTEAMSKDHWMSEFEKSKAEEEEERKRREAERKARQKRREEKLKQLKKIEKKINKENRKKVGTPYRLLWTFSIMFTLMFVLLILFIQLELFKSVFFTFWVFVSLFFGGGLIMIGAFYLVSVDKEQDLREQAKIDAIEAIEEEKRIEEEERAELESIEKQVEIEHLTDLPRAHQLQQGEGLPSISNSGLLGNEMNLNAGLESNIPVTSVGGNPMTKLPESMLQDDTQYELTELDIPSGHLNDDLRMGTSVADIGEPIDSMMDFDLEAKVERQPPLGDIGVASSQNERIDKSNNIDNDYVERVFG
jgi:hypothetical protein